MKMMLHAFKTKQIAVKTRASLKYTNSRIALTPFARNVLAVRHDSISRFFSFYLRSTIPVSESKDLRQVSRASHRLLRGFVYSVSKRLGALRVKCKTQFARLA